jgi:hypothetical protein
MLTADQLRAATAKWMELENAGARCTVLIYRTSRAMFRLHLGAIGALLGGVLVSILTSFTWYVVGLYCIGIACQIGSHVYGKRAERHMEAHRQLILAMLKEVEALAIPAAPEIVGEGRRAGGDAQPSTPQPLSPDPDSDSKWLL